MPDPPAPTNPDQVERAFALHRSRVGEVLGKRRPEDIKALYVELGELLEEAVGADVGSVPVLSIRETAPIVGELLTGVEGVVLDAGCGPNPALSILLARSSARRVVGLDIGFATVRLARAVAAAEGVDLAVVVGDLERLPFRTGAFAGGACDDTIEHVPHDAAGVAELARVTRAGGTMIVATPNRRSAQVLGRRLGDLLRGRRLPREDYFAATSHLREYTWSELERLMAGSFRVTARRPVGWSEGRWAKVSSALARLGMLRPLSRMIIVRAVPRRAVD